MLIEFKTADGRLSPQQARIVRDTTKLYAPVFVCRSLSEAIAAYNAIAPRLYVGTSVDAIV
jgi:hypothetical protein